MNLDEIIRQLKASVFALDNLQVKGRENLDILLGTMQSIDRQIAALAKFKQELDESFKVEVIPEEEASAKSAE